MGRFEITATESLAPVGTMSSADGLFDLGISYASGRDGTIDLVAAHKWFNLAALRGNEAAKRYRQEVASELTKSDVARALKMAREWLAQN